jgi:acetyl esterase/lipase
VRVLTDQTYAVADGVDLRFDLFRPDSDDILPLVVVLHGGGWISGSKEDSRDLAISLAHQGFAAACPGYRLAPLHPYPAAVEDVRGFIEFARDHAADWGVDPNRIAALGNSAGGHLAAMAGVSDNPSQLANAVVDLCGIADLTRPREQHHMIAWGFLEQFMGVPYDGHESTYQAASPLWQLRSALPPFYVVHGEADDVVPVQQSDTLVAALRRLEVPVEYLRIPGEDHSFSRGSFPMIERGYVSFLREKFGVS